MRHLKLFESFNTADKIDRVNNLLNKYLADKESPILVPRIFDKIELKSITKGDTTSYYIENKDLQVKSKKIQYKFYDLFVQLYDDYRVFTILNVMKVNKVADGEIQISADFFYFIEIMFRTYCRNSNLTIYLTLYSESNIILRDSIKKFIAKLVSIDEEKVIFVNFPFVLQSDVHDIKQNLKPWTES